MNYLEVKEIEFKSTVEANKTKNYPESGFYVRIVDDEAFQSQELIFVDKSVPHTNFVCPKSVYDGISKNSVLEPEKENVVLTAIEAKPNGMVSETFVLDFTKILIGKK